MYRIPIETLKGPAQPSTMDWWGHALREYGHLQHHRPEAGGEPRGRQRGRNDDETNLARIPLVEYDFDHKVLDRLFLF